MNLQEALFLSSLSKAEYTREVPLGDDVHQYRVQVEIKDEEYIPLIGPNPSYRDVYEITVSRVVDGKVYPPHHTEIKHSLESCVEFLQIWQVGEEYLSPWQPVEQWEESAQDVMGEEGSK